MCSIEILPTPVQQQTTCRAAADLGSTQRSQDPNMSLKGRGSPVVEGTWLYAGSIPSRIVIVRRDIRYGTGDYEDPPEVAEDQEVETFEVLYASPTDPTHLAAGGGQYFTVEAASAAAEAVCGVTVQWDDGAPHRLVDAITLQEACGLGLLDEPGAGSSPMSDAQPTSLKLATWNLAAPATPGRREILRAHTDRQQADIWVLTETHDAFTPGLPFSTSSAPGQDGTHAPEHRWVTIWSRYPLEPILTSDPQRTAAARITSPTGSPFLVHGTVLPWIGSTWRDHPSAGGVAFREALSLQIEDWMQLRRVYPADEIFVLGDLNQDLVGSPHYYGSRENRDAVEYALARAGLTALTAGDADPVRRDSAPCAGIDHICARRDSTWRASRTERWPELPVPQPSLSDHFGVSVLLTPRR